ncbi:MAG: 2Fe-2S iron-sulfur cluster-binding protein [Candidatus Bathyarchaeia archaeon]
MNKEQKGKIVARVFRFNPTRDTKPRYGVYEVPADEPMTILTMLKYIRTRLDSTLAFRDYICYKGICANCMVRVNGKPVRACSTRVSPGEEVTVEPLAQHPVIRDLVVDFGAATQGDEASYILRRGVVVDIVKPGKE